MFPFIKKFYMELILIGVLVLVLTDNWIEHLFSFAAFLIVTMTLLAIYLAHLLWPKNTD